MHLFFNVCSLSHILLMYIAIFYQKKEKKKRKIDYALARLSPP